MSTQPIMLPQQSGGYTNTKRVRTASGVFHTGMTLDDAKMIGRDKCVLRRDFSNVDKNGDNVLTNDEIMVERQRESKMLGFDAFLCGAFALDDWIRIFKGNRTVWNFAFAGLFTAFAIDSLSRKSKLKKINEDIKQQLMVNG